jgi:phosphoribosylaminoimidazole (AIR) synthetase
MGIGMVVIVKADKAAQVCKYLKGSKIIGKVVSGKKSVELL